MGVHEIWLGMVQPVMGLVVSVPVLQEADVYARRPAEEFEAFRSAAPAVSPDGDPAQARRGSVAALFAALGYAASHLHTDVHAFHHMPPDGHGEVLAPTFAVARSSESLTSSANALVWDRADVAELDKDDPQGWAYPVALKFERLLRAHRMPLGFLLGASEFRLVYAPYGESTGSISFRYEDMWLPDGRPLFDALCMLCARERLFSVQEGKSLRALCDLSRKWQAQVTSELAGQVLMALEALVSGFDAACKRDGEAGAMRLRDALEPARDFPHGKLTRGLLTVLLRIVFLLYAEDGGLLPTDTELYSKHLSLFALFARLQSDRGRYPDSMGQRFSAYGQLLAIFRTIFLGAETAAFSLPPRKGELFDPAAYPFLEGWTGLAMPHLVSDLAEVQVPSVSDGVILTVLEKLIVFEGQRLSYRALDVEQIGSIYEGLMGFDVRHVLSPAVRIGPGRAWVELEALIEQPKAMRAAWLQEECALPKAQAKKLADEVNEARGAAEVLAVLEANCVKHTRTLQPGQLMLQPGKERRRTSSHYTPRSLSGPVVRRTLEPLLRVMGAEPSSARILNLKVCDPAMGSGAFLVEACRALGEALERAWVREAQAGGKPVPPNPTLEARRLVAEHCLYGVDKNPEAVTLAKLSLWLVTLAANRPFSFLDHALKCGDSLAGLTLEQVRRFTYLPAGEGAGAGVGKGSGAGSGVGAGGEAGKAGAAKKGKAGKKEKGQEFLALQGNLFANQIEQAVQEAVYYRQKLYDLPADAAHEEKRACLEDSEDALARVKTVADIALGAFFCNRTEKERAADLKRREGAVETWLMGNGPKTEAIAEMEAASKEKVPDAFHWPLEFPEVFFAGRPDPLDDDRKSAAACFDAFVGNPPFMGGRRIRSEIGDSYTEWLGAAHACGLNADLSAHFFRRADALLGRHGTIGLIATNTIAQGDTREAGLQYLVEQGLEIYDAMVDMAWPGAAAVTVSVVALAKGRAKQGIEVRRLGDVEVAEISSQLGAAVERANPVALGVNASLSFQGCVVLGMGFTLRPEEAERLIQTNPKNKQRIFDYLGGEEVNTSPTQSPHRHVINFGDMSLDEAEAWPDLVKIVREKVKPERDKVNRDAHRKYWWHFGDKRPALYGALAPLSRCLVICIVSKHLMASFQPANRVFANTLQVFPLDTFSPFAVLQSRVHEPWARLLSSTMEDRLRYAASDCFETFPFPSPDPRVEIPALERAGKALYEARAEYMKRADVGLTKTYNAIKDPGVQDAAIAALRELHEALDRAVLDAYGWSDLTVPPYCAASEADTAAQKTFSEAIIDRLYALNAERAKQEANAAPAKAAKPAKATRPRVTKPNK